jgi:hypothetical protein
MDSLKWQLLTFIFENYLSVGILFAAFRQQGGCFVKVTTPLLSVERGCRESSTMFIAAQCSYFTSHG